MLWVQVQPFINIFEFCKVVQQHMQLRWDGRSCNSYIKSFFGNLNFENWSTFAEVMIRSQMYCFFDSQFMSPQLESIYFKILSIIVHGLNEICVYRSLLVSMLT